MWERRLPQDIVAVQRRKRYSRFNPAIPLLGAVLTAWLPVISLWQGWGGKRTPPRPPEPFDEALLTYPIAFLFLFIAFYLIRILGLFRLTNPTLICIRCRTVQTKPSSGRCSCGGELEPLEYWAWEEDRPAHLS